MSTWHILKSLRCLGYHLKPEGGCITYRYQGGREPDPSQVAPLLEALKAHKREALALLEAEMQGENPSCRTCPWCMDNPWTHYPDLPLWCGYWWDHLRADSGWCYERRHGQVPDPQPQARDHDPVRRPTSHDFDRGKGLPFTCFECAHFRPSQGENPRQAWGKCARTGRGRYGAARACDALLVAKTGKEMRK